MSQFDSLLDLEDTGTSSPTKQQTDTDAFDPFGAPDSNMNGGEGDLLDLGFDMQVSSQNGNAKVSLEANTNPLYELTNDKSEDISNNANKETDIMNSEPVNPLYDFSNDSQSQELKSSSSNPLYDFLETETTTNGHTEDLLGVTDAHDVDLLGTAVSDDSGVTMETNHLDATHEDMNGTQEEVTDEQRDEDSDIQGQTVNGMHPRVNEDQVNKGPLEEVVDQTFDQGTVDQDVRKSELTEPDNIADQSTEEQNGDIEIAEPSENLLEPEQTAEELGQSNIAVEDISNEEIATEPVPATEELKPAEEFHTIEQEVRKDVENAVDEVDNNGEIAKEEQSKLTAESDVLPGIIEDDKFKANEQEKAKEEYVTEEFEEKSEAQQPSMEEAESQTRTDVESMVVEPHTEQQQDEEDITNTAQQAEELREVTLDNTEVEPEPVVHQPELTTKQPEQLDHIEQKPAKQEKEAELQELKEPDEETARGQQTDKLKDSSKDTQNEGALKVNGTSVENDVGGHDDEPVRDPNIFRETREKEEVHFTELNNVRQRFESGTSNEDCTPKRHHSVKDDYDQGGEYESTPTVNPDTIKATDTTEEALPEVGTAKNLLSKFQELEKESAVPRPSERRGVTPPRQSKVEYESTPKERSEQYVGKSEAGVFESQPSVNQDVIRYGEHTEEEPVLEKGYAKSMVSKYKEYEEEHTKVKTREKKELTPDRTGKVEYVSEPRGQSITDYDVKVESGVFESTPKVEEDVVRADEKPDEILPEQGIAKNLLSKFKQLETEVGNHPPPSPDRAAKREFVSGGHRGYLERYAGKSEDGQKTPTEVVRSDEVQEDFRPEAGSAKKGMERFKELEKQSNSPPVPQYRKEFTPPRENAPGQTMAGVLENTPTERLEGVVKSTDVYESELPERGTSKKIANIFKQRIESEGSSGSTTPTKGKKEFTPPPEAGVYENVPTAPLVVEQRKAESGVLESTPTARFDVAREHDPSPEKELPETGYAKNMVSKFRQLESESAKGSSSGSPQKYKEFTPPRDAHGLLSPKSPAGLSEGIHLSDLPGQYQQQVSAGIYENQPESRPDLMREADTDWAEGLPQKNTAKSMKQRFQEMEDKALKELETPEPIHRKDDSLVHSDSEDKGIFMAVQHDKCSACEKTVYAMEKLEMNKNIYHRGCFKCSHCSATLTAKTFSINEGVIYCTTHFKQLFARKGNYDEGFGRQQYKKKWTEEQLKKKDSTG